ncbi:LysR substrate-binding domain-containing protein [Ensifer canadensis]
MPQHPHDFLEHACIRHRFASGFILPWEFGDGEGAISISPPAVVTANSVDLEIAAVVDGLGVVRTFEEFLAPHLKSGSLVPILDQWVTPFPGPFLDYASRRHMPAPLRAFVDFLKADQRSRAR